MKMRSWLLLAVLSYSGIAGAQRIDALGPDVRKVLHLSTPKAILEQFARLHITERSDVFGHNYLFIICLLTGRSNTDIKIRFPPRPLSPEKGRVWRLTTRQD